MADAATLTIRLPAAVKAQLAAVAQATGRSEAALAADAVQQYLAIEAWQVEEITRALAEAEAGDFATAAEVEAAFARWLPKRPR